MNQKLSPRIIDSKKTFDALVQWFYDEMIRKQKAPGFLVGLSGTDSIVAFCAAYKALEKANMANRMLGVHFAPSEDFLYDHPEAAVHLWFRDAVLPWLKTYAPKAEIVVDTSIDWRCDGLRWGALMDMSVVENNHGRKIRLPEEQYWVVGTRNRTEHILMTYSNVSTAVSIQPIIDLWKSEILQISEYLKVPQVALKKSCETDCICGRMQIAAQYPREIDEFLMVQLGEANMELSMSKALLFQVGMFVTSQQMKNGFKMNIPYIPEKIAIIDELVSLFENNTLKLNEFNHYKHLYIAWHYLKHLSFEASILRYSHYLKIILDAAGYSQKFNLDITRAYFEKIDKAMKLYPTDTFDELVEKLPSVLEKISA